MSCLTHTSKFLTQVFQGSFSQVFLCCTNPSISLGLTNKNSSKHEKYYLCYTLNWGTHTILINITWSLSSLLSHQNYSFKCYSKVYLCNSLKQKNSLLTEPRNFLHIATFFLNIRRETVHTFSWLIQIYRMEYIHSLSLS